MKSCIIDITGLLSNIIETRDSIITITVQKHLAKKLRPMFAMLHRLEGVPKFSGIRKQREDLPKKSSAKPTTLVKPIHKKNFFFLEEPIIDKSEEEEIDEEELKRKKARESELDENQRIVREVDTKEKTEREAQVTLERRKLLFPVWML